MLQVTDSFTFASGGRGKSGHRQQGSALVVSLIMLLLLSLIAIGSMQDTLLQDSMVTNTADRAIAFENAEAALRAGEQFAWFNGTTGGVQLNPTTNWALVAPGTAVPSVDPRADAQPAYHIGPPRVPQALFVELPSDGAGIPLELYYVTSRAVGARPQTEVMLRSIIGRRAD
ncbi:MAG: hypothetical protein LAT63_12535 [Marinobacter sp.]|nr:hypothetical protein [Marinobacter sp.]